MARRAVAERLGEALAPSVLNDAKLIVSEIVTNSVQHAKLKASDWVGLVMNLEAASRVARVEVFDPGDGFDAPATKPDLLAKGGRGLHLVEQLALRWGVIRKTATVVWFEVPVDAR